MKNLSSFAYAVLMVFFTASLNAQVNYVKRINCGSTSAATYQGNSFDADIAGGGVAFTGDRTTTGSSYFTLAQPLKSSRYTKNQSMNYTFNVSNGDYNVRLLFAEPYHGVQPGTNAATRKFNFDIEGQYSDTNMNIMTEAGGANQVYTVNQTVTVSDGQLTITFSKGSGNDPLINAIEVLGQSGGGCVAPPVPTLNSVTEVTHNSAKLDWTYYDNGVDYTTYVYGNTTELMHLQSHASSWTSVTIDNLQPNTSYTFDVGRSGGPGCFSGHSNTITITTLSDPGNCSSASWTESGDKIYTPCGKVGIGTSIPDAELTVKGEIHAEEVNIDLNVPGPDYVFLADYDLKTLEEVKNYIDTNGHLPNIPSAKEMEKNGINVVEMNMKLLEKVEELTLYIIELKDEVEKLKKNQKQ